jgi:spore germination protein YaaH
MQRGRRSGLITVAIIGFVLVVTAVGLIGAGGIGIGTFSATTTTSGGTPSVYAPYLAAETSGVARALADVNVKLPQTIGAPAPTAPANPFKRPLGSRTVLGFLPSWQLADASTVPYSSLSEVAYYALEVQPHGTILQSGYGWDDLANGSVAPLVSGAHAHGARALLTLFSNTNSTLDALANDPVASGTALAEHVAPLLSQHGFDGVDLDLEGTQAIARSGFVKFVAAFSSKLRSLDPTWTIVLNTFPQSAVDSTSFFDVKALAPSVDQFFVMAYDMSDLSIPGPTAPLDGAELSDASTLASYTATVPASKVILGIPFYGFDFPATRSKPPSDSTGTPISVSYSSVVQAGRRVLWDPVTDTAFSSFVRSGHWHQTWFDNPLSVALKVALAAEFQAGGVGAWELGMANGQPQITSVLDGGSPPKRLGLARQP